MTNEPEDRPRHAYRDPSPRAPDPATLELEGKKRATLVRWRAGALVLALVVPAIFYAAFERQARRLEALADHGVRATATVRVVTAQYTEYDYVVDTRAYRSSVAPALAPSRPGEDFPIRVLPEDPSFSRPGKDGAEAAREAASNRSRFPLFLAAPFAVFALVAALAQRDIRRIDRRAAPPRPPSVRTVSRLVAALLVGACLAVNAYDDVHAVQVAAFGERPFGLPVRWVCVVAQAVLAIPFVPVLEHLVRLMFAAQRDGLGGGAVGLALYGTTERGRRDELRRSWAFVLAGLAYFVVLVGAWIAFASARGI